jgi:hypothetical protein
MTTEKNIMKIKPKTECSTCDVDNDYVCFECESIFIRDNYPYYFYNDDCEWELRRSVA